MDMKLLNYINVDLKWNSVKKGRRSMTRHPRKVQDTTAFETNKIVDAPKKKRKLLQKSPLPPPQTPYLHGDSCLPAGPLTPSVPYEDPSQWSHSRSISQTQNTKSKTRLRNKNIKKVDFSGIELLAATACSSLINDSTDHISDQKVLKEHMEPDGSLNQDTWVPDSLNLQEYGNQKAAPTKGLRLHWDLNTVMDDWEEEPCDLITSVPLVEICNGDSLRKTCEDLVTKTITSKTSDCESCVSKSDVVVDSLIHPVKCEDLSTSTTSVLQEEEEETTVKGESMSKSDQEPVFEEVILSKSFCDKKVISEEDPASEECCGSNVTQDEQGGDVDKVQEAACGYDSPFEDGELREENDEVSDNNTPTSIELEKVNHGQSQTTDTSIVQENTVDIPQSQHDVEESESGSGKESSARKNVHVDESLCRNVTYVPQSRSSNIARSYEHYRPKNINRNYHTPSGGYRDYNRRPSSSERYNVYCNDIHRAPNRYRFHSQDYSERERKVRCYSPRKRSRSRSPSGSPIAWHFQKPKKLDVTTQSVDRVSPERLSKRFDDRKFTDKRESMNGRIGYPERLKSDDHHHIRFSEQQSGRFSTHKYNNESGYGYNTRK